MRLKDGDEIFLIRDPNVKAYICGSRIVKEKDGIPMTITALATILHDRYHLGPTHLGGFEYFAFDDQDKNLYDRYNRIINELNELDE
jgi:hypothetical protein